VTMELLIIKSGSEYIRVKEQAYLLCKIDKASVFSLEKLTEVKRHVEAVRNSGFQDVSIRKLVLREEPLDE